MITPRWGLVLAAYGPLFAAWPFLASPYSLPKLLVLALATAAAGWGALNAASEPKPKKKPEPGPDLSSPLMACLGVMMLSGLLAFDQPASLLGEYSMRSHGILTLALCASLAALAQGAGLPAARFALFAGAAAGAGLAAYAVLQVAGLDPVFNAVGGQWYGRSGSLVGSPVGLGACLATLAPVQLGAALDGETPGRRRLGWLFLALGTVGLVVTWSRGAWLAAAFGLACQLLWTGRLTRGLAMKLAAGGAVAGLALALATGRMRPTGKSDLGRVEVWKSAARMFVAHPVLGVGPDNFSLMLGRHKTEGFVRAHGWAGGQAHAHNDFLQALATTGLAGFAAYLWLLGTAWGRLKRALRDDEARATSAAAGAGLAAAFLAAKLNPLTLDGLALAALLLGLLDPRGTRRAPGTAFALGGAGAAAAIWLLVADARCYAGMKAQNAGRLDEARAAYAAAARLNPFEDRYGFWLVGALRARAREEQDAAVRLALGVESVAAARTLERRHPFDARALHALGGSLAALALQGGPDGMAEAAAVLERGARADWAYRPVHETRLTVARLRKDARASADGAASLARIDALGR